MQFLDDLECDFQVFFGVRNMYDLPSQEFLAKAVRMGAYSGAVGARIAEQKRREAERGRGPSEGAQRPSSPHRPPRQTLAPGALPKALQAKNGFPSVIQMS
ncbi:hypothetical protein [Streptomyces californicus]|uniref:hypothetical protein n=1 Tax=Streptomyces californicus TaxID=67351 RepID=UPI0033EC45C1